MTIPPVDDLNIRQQTILITPAQLKARYPLSDALRESISQRRGIIHNILDRKDNRLLVIVGPCSIHDTHAALAYAQRLKTLADQVSDTLYVVMRVYFEKPRTTTGWKGLINDPYLDDTFQIQDGLQQARALLLAITEIGLPCATEALDPITPQYLHDLISWAAIGARTTESQTHREMASGLSSAVGFKNGTDGSLAVAIHALQSAAHPHRFLGINTEGQVALIHTQGNRYGHVVLRGGNDQPNYDAPSIARCEHALQNAGLRTNIMVDCSHANAHKDHTQQIAVLENVTQQRLAGNPSIIGVMLESHLNAGKQSLPPQLADLRYGVSITDACIDWQTTETALLALDRKFKAHTAS